MSDDRSKLVVHVGNLLEFVAAGLAVYGVDALAGWRWSVIAGAAVAGVLAEFLYDDTVLRLPLPRIRRRNANGLPAVSNQYPDE